MRQRMTVLQIFFCTFIVLFYYPECARVFVSVCLCALEKFYFLCEYLPQIKWIIHAFFFSSSSSFLFCFVLVLSRIPIHTHSHTFLFFPCINKPKCKKSLHTHTQARTYPVAYRCSFDTDKVITMAWTITANDKMMTMTMPMPTKCLGHTVHGYPIPFLVKYVISLPKI